VFSLFLLSSKHAKSFSDSSGNRTMFTEAALLRMSRLLFVGSYLQFLRPIKTTEKIIGMIIEVIYLSEFVDLDFLLKVN
jgi:hypothetical protein